MNRKELVDLVCELVEDEGDGSSDISAEELKAERQRIKKQGKYLKTLKSTLAVLIVVAAIAVLISVLFLPKTLDNHKHRGYNNFRTDLLFLH